MPDKFYCFSANRLCHHDDYCLLISKFIDVENIKSTKRKILLCFSKSNIIFLNIDGLDLLFTPLILLRTLWGGRGSGISVRTEYLLEKRTLKQFVFNNRRLRFIKSVIKRVLFYMIKSYSNTKIISIHKNHYQRNIMEPYVTEFIYDPQLWDLKFIKLDCIRPPELNAQIFNQNKSTLLIAGRFNDQRSKSELLSYIKAQSNFIFIIAGIVDSKDHEELVKAENCVVINRYLENEELMYLLTQTDVIYCFYTNSRPSGFFGRALQLGKPIVVRKHGYLDVSYTDYGGKIAVNNLKELNNYNIKDVNAVLEGNNHYDDSEKFVQIITSFKNHYV